VKPPERPVQVSLVDRRLIVGRLASPDEIAPLFYLASGFVVAGLALPFLGASRSAAPGWAALAAGLLVVARGLWLRHRARRDV
jgi:hypothetical protein